jgi:hypothetical protein
MGETGPNPTDRRKTGSKHHLLVDDNGTPINIILTGANRHDSTQLMPLIEGMPSIAGRRGHPLVKPKCVQADRGYNSERYRILPAAARNLLTDRQAMRPAWQLSGHNAMGGQA